MTARLSRFNRPNGFKDGVLCKETVEVRYRFEDHIVVLESVHGQVDRSPLVRHCVWEVLAKKHFIFIIAFVLQ